MSVKIDWKRLGRAFEVRAGQVPGKRVALAAEIGLTRPTFYRAIWGQPLDAETFLTVCDWLGESPNAFRLPKDSPNAR